MKRKILTLIMLFVVTVSFAQVPKHLRVLNYVPDSCYSLTMMNLDTIARVMELESLHRENVLKPLYDSLKFSKKLIQSWIKKDNKLGIDFTASAAFVDSRYFLLPLNNEKNFEKTVRSIEKSMPKFETMTDLDGRKIRCLVVEDASVELSVAVFCTEDVACLALLTDPNALYSSALQPTIDVESDTVDIEQWINTMCNNLTESPMKVWTRLSRSKFAESQTVTNMLTKGWSSYTAYKQGSSILRTLSSAMGMLFPASGELQKTVKEMDLEMFSRVEARHDRLTSYSEVHARSEQPGLQALKSSPEKLKKLLPYVSGDYMSLVVSAMEGYGDLAKPYMDTYPQWRELCPLFNKPFVFTASALDDNNMQIVTLVEHPEKVQGILERFVEISNHITDSINKSQPIVLEDVVEEPAVATEEVVEVPVEPANEEPMDYPWIEQEDSTINMKTLVYKKIGGWDAYIIITKKSSMDYETFTRVVKDDSACVLVKDDLLFYTKSLNALESLSQPMEREWPKEYLEHNLFARIDFGSFVALLGPEAAMPVRDMDFYFDGNTFTMNINAELGLRHGVLYEVVKFVVDIVRSF